eukprot:3355134-Alexandrium_andersonii.AAC.1
MGRLSPASSPMTCCSRPARLTVDRTMRSTLWTTLPPPGPPASSCAPWGVSFQPRNAASSPTGRRSGEF